MSEVRSTDHQLETAFPIRDLNEHPGPIGLTKRELFAAMAMQGLLANPHFFEHAGRGVDIGVQINEMALKAANALLLSLETGT